MYSGEYSFGESIILLRHRRERESAISSLDGLLVLEAEEEEPDDCPILLISPFSSLKFGIQSLSPAALTYRLWASEPT